MRFSTTTFLSTSSFITKGGAYKFSGGTLLINTLWALADVMVEFSRYCDLKVLQHVCGSVCVCLVCLSTSPTLHADYSSVINRWADEDVDPAIYAKELMAHAAAAVASEEV